MSKGKSCGWLCRICKWLFGRSLGTLALGLGTFILGVGAIIAARQTNDILNKITETKNVTKNIESAVNELKTSNRQLQKTSNDIKKTVHSLQEASRQKLSQTGTSEVLKRGPSEELSKEKTVHKLNKVLKEFSFETKDSRPWGIYMSNEDRKKLVEEYKKSPMDQITLQKKIYQNLTIPNHVIPRNEVQAK